ncbi:cytospin-A-like isoform X1 [Betta splendens]|uniref:Cytospin-A n=2 Tax=Betta splendens TaxID=158456 RepID=A0A6P7LUC8_BETSP|nr:cytospin-A-like isoform X1 [Betta splendens]XP_028997511.1 cytospin-A-like isoform X1 [Betta splendens]XP_028997512.1 cytospin-A-like isoform X1 [Betta splendens]XP_028997513.1 cytospin-A-like isoform X1 [Betta splendens]XP_055362516.1 cytospin-A-like isoform X1 [Betta splendens]
MDELNRPNCLLVEGFHPVDWRIWLYARTNTGESVQSPGDFEAGWRRMRGRQREESPGLSRCLTLIPGFLQAAAAGLANRTLKDAEGAVPDTQPCGIMGNHAGKDGHGPTGSPLDFFHTPPTTPSEAVLAAMALSSAAAASSNKARTPSPTSPVADWTQKLPAASEWDVISVNGAGGAAASPGSRASPSRSPSQQSWKERDGGVEPQAAAESAGEEVTLVLLSLMEHYRASVGLNPNTDLTTGSVELLRRLISEREELLEEVDTLKETLRAERCEWHQFQSDLQVAVSVADRLRVESDQALSSLQERHRTLEEQLSQVLSREQEKDTELQVLRAEHADLCHRVSELTLQQQDRAELDALRTTRSVTDHTDAVQEAEAVYNNVEMQKNQANLENDEDEGPEDEAGSENMPLSGKGVAEGYLQSVAALEEKKKEGGRGQRDPRRIVMLSERSWSLSRLPLPPDSTSQSDTSKNTSTTLPLCKKEEPTKRRRVDRILQRQDSWSSFYTVKQDDDQSSDSVKPQDGFSALLRRHGGSRRNSLLRWCQSRTQSYQNIDITNFSSSWEDGLAFCALYHTYVPTHIPYESLSPADKEDNLDLAFKTGEKMGITATLTVEEMLKAGGPDWQRVLGYVESIFRHFEM